MLKKNEKNIVCPIYQFLLYPDLIFGCEKRLFYILALLSTLIIFSFFNPILFIIGVVFFINGLILIRFMAKCNPFMSKIFFQSLKYQKYYPARSTPFSKGAIFKRNKLV